MAEIKPQHEAHQEHQEHKANTGLFVQLRNRRLKSGFSLSRSFFTEKLRVLCATSCGSYLLMLLVIGGNAIQFSLPMIFFDCLRQFLEYGFRRGHKNASTV